MIDKTLTTRITSQNELKSGIALWRTGVLQIYEKEIATVREFTQDKKNLTMEDVMSAVDKLLPIQENKVNYATELAFEFEKQDITASSERRKSAIKQMRNKREELLLENESQETARMHDEDAMSRRRDFYEADQQNEFARLPNLQHSPANVTKPFALAVGKGQLPHLPVSGMTNTKLRQSAMQRSRQSHGKQPMQEMSPTLLAGGDSHIFVGPKALPKPTGKLSQLLLQSERKKSWSMNEIIESYLDSDEESDRCYFMNPYRNKFCRSLKHQLRVTWDCNSPISQTTVHPAGPKGGAYDSNQEMEEIRPPAPLSRKLNHVLNLKLVGEGATELCEKMKRSLKNTVSSISPFHTEQLRAKRRAKKQVAQKPEEELLFPFLTHFANLPFRYNNIAEKEKECVPQPESVVFTPVPPNKSPTRVRVTSFHIPKLEQPAKMVAYIPRKLRKRGVPARSRKERPHSPSGLAVMSPPEPVSVLMFERK